MSRRVGCGKCLAAIAVLNRSAAVACGGASSSEQQAEQLRAAVTDPATINDKLFILCDAAAGRAP
jgi:hypothetical protein